MIACEISLNLSKSFTTSAPLTTENIECIERKIDLFSIIMKNVGIDLIDDKIKEELILEMQKLIK